MGRHHLRPNTAEAPIGWLACNTLPMGAQTPANLRECHNCGVQVLVPLTTCALVDSGALRARCWYCQARTGRPVLLHDIDAARLDAVGQLAQGWRVIAEINEWLDDLRAEIGQVPSQPPVDLGDLPGPTTGP